MCTDYLKVKQLMCQDCYPLPRIDDLLDQMGEATYVSMIDLLRGYYQVQLLERAKRFSAFVIPDFLY